MQSAQQQVTFLLLPSHADINDTISMEWFNKMTSMPLCVRKEFLDGRCCEEERERKIKLTLMETPRPVLTSLPALYAFDFH